LSCLLRGTGNVAGLPLVFIKKIIRSEKMPEVNGQRVRVLIVDDEPDIREMLCDLLSFDYDCSAAPSAEDALALVRDRKFHLVVSDITMGRMSGLQMIPHILAKSPDTVVVMISGMQTIESAIEALRLGAFDYIMKPFDLRQVEAAVKRAIEHYELRDAKRRY